MADSILEILEQELKNPNKRNKEKMKSGDQIAKICVNQFFQAIQADLFPQIENEKIFGVEKPEIRTWKKPEDSEIGDLVSCQIVSSLNTAQLPNIFKAAVIAFNLEHPEENYPKILVQRDLRIHKAFEKLHYLQYNQRFEIDSAPIKVAYGFDPLNGYFLSVYDKRLEYQSNATKEVNEIAGKIGVGDGGGSYFDLHTGENGFGFKVKIETIAEYMKRYGVKQDHLESVKKGRNFSN